MADILNESILDEEEINRESTINPGETVLEGGPNLGETEPDPINLNENEMLTERDAPQDGLGGAPAFPEESEEGPETFTSPEEEFAPIKGEEPPDEGPEIFNVKDLLLSPFRGTEKFVQDTYNFIDWVAQDALPDWKKRALGDANSIIGGFATELFRFAIGFVLWDKGLGKVAKLGKLDLTYEAQAAANLVEKGWKGKQVLPLFNLGKKAERMSIGGQIIDVQRATAAGVLTDWTQYNAQEERFSNLIQSVPGLANPVTEYLQHEEGESQAMGRIKQALEGAVMGFGIDALLSSIRIWKGARAIKENNGTPKEVADHLKAHLPEIEDHLMGTKNARRVYEEPLERGEVDRDAIDGTRVEFGPARNDLDAQEADRVGTGMEIEQYTTTGPFKYPAKDIVKALNADEPLPVLNMKGDVFQPDYDVEPKVLREMAKKNATFIARHKVGDNIISHHFVDNTGTIYSKKGEEIFRPMNENARPDYLQDDVFFKETNPNLGLVKHYEQSPVDIIRDFDDNGPKTWVDPDTNESYRLHIFGNYVWTSDIGWVELETGIPVDVTKVNVEGGVQFNTPPGLVRDYMSLVHAERYADTSIGAVENQLKWATDYHHGTMFRRRIDGDDYPFKTNMASFIEDELLGGQGKVKGESFTGIPWDTRAGEMLFTMRFYGLDVSDGINKRSLSESRLLGVEYATKQASKMFEDINWRISRLEAGDPGGWAAPGDAWPVLRSQRSDIPEATRARRDELLNEGRIVDDEDVEAFTDTDEFDAYLDELEEGDVPDNWFWEDITDPEELRNHIEEFRDFPESWVDNVIDGYYDGEYVRGLSANDLRALQEEILGEFGRFLQGTSDAIHQTINPDGPVEWLNRTELRRLSTLWTVSQGDAVEDLGERVFGPLWETLGEEQMTAARSELRTFLFATRLTEAERIREVLQGLPDIDLEELRLLGLQEEGAFDARLWELFDVKEHELPRYQADMVREILRDEALEILGYPERRRNRLTEVHPRDFRAAFFEDQIQRMRRNIQRPKDPTIVKKINGPMSGIARIVIKNNKNRLRIIEALKEIKPEGVSLKEMNQVLRFLNELPDEFLDDVDLAFDFAQNANSSTVVNDLTEKLIVLGPNFHRGIKGQMSDPYRDLFHELVHTWNQFLPKSLRKEMDEAYEATSARVRELFPTLYREFVENSGVLTVPQKELDLFEDMFGIKPFSKSGAMVKRGDLPDTDTINADYLSSIRLEPTREAAQEIFYRLTNTFEFIAESGTDAIEKFLDRPFEKASAVRKGIAYITAYLQSLIKRLLNKPEKLPTKDGGHVYWKRNYSRPPMEDFLEFALGDVGKKVDWYKYKGTQPSLGGGKAQMAAGGAWNIPRPAGRTVVPFQGVDISTRPEGLSRSASNLVGRMRNLLRGSRTAMSPHEDRFMEDLGHLAGDAFTQGSRDAKGKGAFNYFRLIAGRIWESYKAGEFGYEDAREISDIVIQQFSPADNKSLREIMVAEQRAAIEGNEVLADIVSRSGTPSISYRTIVDTVGDSGKLTDVEMQELAADMEKYRDVSSYLMSAVLGESVLPAGRLNDAVDHVQRAINITASLFEGRWGEARANEVFAPDNLRSLGVIETPELTARHEALANDPQIQAADKILGLLPLSKVARLELAEVLRANPRDMSTFRRKLLSLSEKDLNMSGMYGSDGVIRFIAGLQRTYSIFHEVETLDEAAVGAFNIMMDAFDPSDTDNFIKQLMDLDPGELRVGQKTSRVNFKIANDALVFYGSRAVDELERYRINPQAFTEADLERLALYIERTEQVREYVTRWRSETGRNLRFTNQDFIGSELDSPEAIRKFDDIMAVEEKRRPVDSYQRIFEADETEITRSQKLSEVSEELGTGEPEDLLNKDIMAMTAKEALDKRGGVAMFRAELDKIIPTMDGHDLTHQKIGAMLRTAKGWKNGGGSMIKELWYNSMLSSGRTFTVNLLGTVGYTIFRPLEVMLGATVRRDKETFSQAANELVMLSAQLKDFWKYFKMGFKQGSTLIPGRSREGFSAKSAFQRDNRWWMKGETEAGSFGTGLAAGIEWFGKVVNMPSRLLNSADEAVKQIQYRASMRGELAGEFMRRGMDPQQAWAKAAETLEDTVKNNQAYHSAAVYKEGLDSAENAVGLPRSMYDAYAKDYTKRHYDKTVGQLSDRALETTHHVTFQTPLRKGSFAGHISNMANNWMIMRLAVPFVRTPANLLYITGQHFDLASPLRYLKARIFDGIEEFPEMANLNSKFLQAMADTTPGGAYRRAEAIGKLTMGLSLAVTIGMAYGQGWITGGGPTDSGKATAWKAAGFQPYSIRTPDGHYVSFERFDPLASILGISADIFEYMTLKENPDEGDWERGISAIVMAVASNLDNKTYLSSLADFATLLGEPRKYFPEVISRVGGAVVPTVVSDVARAMDPYERETRSWIDKIARRIPGYGSPDDKFMRRQSLPMMRNLIGEPVEPYKNFAHAFASENAADVLGMIIPVSYSTVSDDVVDAELSLLGRGFAPPTSVKGGIELRDIYVNENGQDAYDRWMELTSTLRIGGRTLREALRAKIKTPNYQKMDHESTFEVTSPRLLEIRKILTRYRRQGYLRVQREVPELRRRIQKRRIDKRRAILGVEL